jgi:protein TonB
MKTSSGRFSVASLLGLGTLVLFAGCTSAPMRQSTLALESEETYIPLGVVIPGYERPVPLATAVPDYPWYFRRLGIDGGVELIVTVDETGRVRDALVASSSDKAFENPSLDAVKKWSFQPATRNGIPVASRVSLPIRFGFNE